MKSAENWPVAWPPETTFATVRGAITIGALSLGDEEVTTRLRRNPLTGASPVRLALILGTSLTVALTAVCGWLGYQTIEARKAEQTRDTLLQVARQGAVNLTTIDYEHAEADVQRILDSATGEFYDEFNSRSAPFVDVVRKAQSKSEGTVTEAGMESITGQEGQVLVAVSVKTTTRGAPDEQPRYWRMRLTVTQSGAETKVSKVEFVP